MTMLDLNTLKSIAEENATSKAVFGQLSSRVRSRGQINLRKLRYDLLTQGQRIVEEEYVEIFKKLQDLGVGKLISGRHGKPTRFMWNYKLVSIAKAAVSAEPTVIVETVKKRAIKSLPKEILAVNESSIVEQAQRVPISITFNLSPDIRVDDLAALISLAKGLK